MKRLTWIFAVVLGIVTLAPAHGGADTDGWSVTGAATALFPAGAELGPVSLSGLEVGTGVLVDPNGSATGAFHAVLHGTAVGGAAQQITLEGKALDGSGDANGTVTFSGTGTLDFGDGTAPFPAIQFSVTATGEGLTVAIDGAPLPAAAVNTGAITVE